MLRKAMLLVLAVAMMLFFSVPLSFADDSTTITSAEFVIGMNQYFVNNVVPGVSMDAAPYIDPNSGRTLVPVRYLGNALGIQGSGIDWNQSTQTVALTSGSTSISMVIGSTTLIVNGQTQTLDQAPVIKDGRAYLPARWVAQALGFQVIWDPANEIVLIYPASSITQPPDNNVIKQVQQNAAQPAAVQKLENVLGITMITGDGNEWYYDPEMNADGSPNITWENQNLTHSFVTADVKNDGSLYVSVECANLVSDPSTINPDLSPLQKALEAIFSGADTSQAMAYAQKCAVNEQTNGGGSKLPADKLTINGTTVFVSQGSDRTTYAEIAILGS